MGFLKQGNPGIVIVDVGGLEEDLELDPDSPVWRAGAGGANSIHASLLDSTRQNTVRM